jgi:hypothetical protein
MSKTLHDLNGWIDREGRIHHCPSNGHKQKALELKSTEQRLEKVGWIKIYNGEFLMSAQCTYRPASHQCTTIWDLCVKYNNSNTWLEFCSNYANV